MRNAVIHSAGPLVPEIDRTNGFGSERLFAADLARFLWRENTAACWASEACVGVRAAEHWLIGARDSSRGHNALYRTISLRLGS